MDSGYTMLRREKGMEIIVDTLVKLEDFLETVPSKNTRKSYKNGIKTFEKFLGYSITKLIKDPNATKRIEKFYVWLKDQGFKQNTARVKTNAIIQFLRYFGTSIQIRKSLGIYRTEICLTDHKLTLSEVRKMSSVADLREQVILQVLVRGYRVADASRLFKKDFDCLDEETPIYLKLYSSKEGKIYHTWISKEFQDLLRLWIPSIENSKYLLPGKRKRSHINSDTLNEILENLAKRAQINLKGKLRWHCGRKLLLRIGVEEGFNQWVAKMITGRSVPKDIETYIVGLDLTNSFKKLEEVLILQPRGNGRIPKMQKELERYRQAMEVIAEAMLRLNRERSPPSPPEPSAPPLSDEFRYSRIAPRTTLFTDEECKLLEEIARRRRK
jgi:site-specific recombinase XerD